MAARESASLFYDGLVAGFVGGATGIDDGRERGSYDASKKPEAVQSDSHQQPILLINKYDHALERRNINRTALSPASIRHLLPHPTSGADSPLLAPPNPDKNSPQETNEGQGQGLQLMVVLSSTLLSTNTDSTLPLYCLTYVWPNH